MKSTVGLLSTKPLAATILLCLLLAGSAHGIILHPAADVLPASQRPPDNVIGRWRNVESCVAIASDWVITSQHQPGQQGDYVVIGGLAYQIGAEVVDHPTADLRLAWLKRLGQPADLQDYVSLYTGSDEGGRDMVIGGYGKQRGDTLYTGGGEAYGYAWGQLATAPVWGQNIINAPLAKASASIDADFDAPWLGRPYEAALADKDSGCGWFIEDAGEWKLAGVGRSVDRMGESWFLNPNTGTPAADKFYGVRVSKYITWANDTINGWKVPGDANDDDIVNVGDLAVVAGSWGVTSGATWEQGDFSGDGAVNVGDLAILAYNWGYGTVGGADEMDLSFVPEPASALLLICGASLLATRRRRK